MFSPLRVVMWNLAYPRKFFLSYSGLLLHPAAQFRKKRVPPNYFLPILTIVFDALFSNKTPFTILNQNSNHHFHSKGNQNSNHENRKIPIHIIKKITISQLSQLKSVTGVFSTQTTTYIIYMWGNSSYVPTDKSSKSHIDDRNILLIHTTK